MQSQPMPLSAEEKIRLQAQLLDRVEQAILVIDLTGRIVFWNRFAERLYGWTEDEVQSRDITEVLAAAGLMESVRTNLEQLRRGAGWSGEFHVQRRDGTLCMTHVSLSLIQVDWSTPAGKPVGRQTPISNASFIAIFLERVELQSESQRLNAELEQRLNERTLELREAVAQLRRSEEITQTMEQQHQATVAELKETSRQLQALTANLELAREEERTQIARELHDQLGQSLTAMKFDLAWLADGLVQKGAVLAQKAKAVTQQMDTMIKTVRRIATELRPGMLDDLGLAASIEWQARDFEKRTGIVCAVNVPTEDLPLAPAQSVALFRIFQEALTNVARHASAQRVEIKLAASPEALTLKVHDDGRGIQAQEIAGPQSLGLIGMRERAKQLGGACDIQRVPGDGTIVTVSIPVKQNE
jgi:PAS domain S-box-containing protein